MRLGGRNIREIECGGYYYRAGRASGTAVISDADLRGVGEHMVAAHPHARAF